MGLLLRRHRVVESWAVGARNKIKMRRGRDSLACRLALAEDYQGLQASIWDTFHGEGEDKERIIGVLGKDCYSKHKHKMDSLMSKYSISRKPKIGAQVVDVENVARDFINSKGVSLGKDRERRALKTKVREKYTVRPLSAETESFFPLKKTSLDFIAEVGVKRSQSSTISKLPPRPTETNLGYELSEF